MGQAQPDWQDCQVKVVVNGELQYSLWPAHRKPPTGWSETGMTGSKEECLDYINSVWRDMRPLSVRS
jgi:MbtH protein